MERDGRLLYAMVDEGNVAAVGDSSEVSTRPICRLVSFGILIGSCNFLSKALSSVPPNVFRLMSGLVSGI